MNKVLLDTDIYSEIIKGRHQNVAKHAKAYKSRFSRYTISVITVIEVVKGFHKRERHDRVNKFISDLAHMEVLPLDIQSSVLAGKIVADLEKIGQTIGQADPVIASIAINHNFPVATGNTDHYKRICDLGYSLILENWKETVITENDQD